MKQRYTLVSGRLRRVGLLFLLVLMATGAWAQGPRLYYTQGSGTASLDAAKAVNADGTAAATLATAASNFSQPTDIAVDKVNGYIYVADQYVGSGGILRYTTAGTGRTVIVAPTAGATYNGLALDVAGNRLFFTQGSATSSALDALKVVNLGTSAVTVLASGAGNFTQPTDVALDAAGGFLYVADQYVGTGGILRFTTTGTGRTVIVPGLANADYNGLALDVAGNRLFFTQGSATAALDALKVVSLSTGFAVTQLASGAGNFTQPTDVALDAAGGFLYVADQYVGTGGILRFTTTGTGRTVFVAPTAGATYNGLALAPASAGPVVTTTGGSATFVEGNNVTSTPVVIDAGVTVSDADNTTLASATASITGGFQTAEDVLAFTNTNAGLYGNVTGSYSAGTGVLTLTSAGATATVAQWQSVLRSITYTNTSNTPNTATRTVSFVANDGALNSPAATKNVSVQAVNDNPIVTTGVVTTVYTHNVPGPSTPVAVDPNVTPSDADNATLATATVSITSNFQSGADVLTFTNTNAGLYGNVTGSYSAGTGVLTLTSAGATATVAQWQSVLRAVTFLNTAAIPNTANRTISFVANDGTSASNTASITVSFTLVVAAPVVSVPANGSTIGTTTPTYSGTAPAGTTVTVIVDGSSIGTVVTAAGGTWALLQPSALTSGSHTVRATATAAGTTSPSSNTNTFVIDTAGPVITSVGVPSNGTYKAGDFLTFAVNFNKPVTVNTTGGTPTLGLTIGSTGRQASYLAGSGSTTLTFRYTVAAGELDLDGVALGSALVLNGGTLQDAVGNNAILTLNSVASTASVLVDAVAPTVLSINRQNPAASLTNATTLVYRITFSENVTGVDASDFSLTSTGGTSGTVSAVAAVSNSVYDVTVAAVAGSGTLRLDLNTSGTGITDVPGNPIGGGYQAGQVYTIDQTGPTVAITSTASSPTSASPIPVTVTFTESVTGFSAAGVTVTNGALSGFSGSGTTYTFNVTPTAGGLVTVNVPANGAQDAAGNGNAAAPQFSITYNVPAVTVLSVTRLTPSPTATAQVSYQVTFSGSVTGLSSSNFSVTSSGLSGASVASVSGSGTTYTVVVNTGIGDGTLRLNVSSTVGISPTASNVPFTTGDTFTIQKNFTSPVLSIQGTGGAGTDVTAFVDQVQVLDGGTPRANALLNSSFETYGSLNFGNYGYNPPGAVWTFLNGSGIALNGSAFGAPTAPNGSAVAFLQNAGSEARQALAVPTGTYQVSFQTSQRVCCSTRDQVLNVFINGVFVGTIQPTNTAGYTTFTSSSFNVTAPSLTTSISSTATSPTAVSPIPVTVTFSQSVTGFSAAGVSVANGTVSGFSGSGSTYTFNVTPTAAGTVTVNVPANVALDANNTGNTAAPAFSITYAPITQVVWNGSVSTDWYTATNWTGGLPTATLDALIPAGAPRYPLITAGTASAKTLTLASGASLAQSGGTLDLKGDFANNGTLNATGGSISLTGAAAQAVGGSSLSTFWNLSVGASGGTLSGPAAVQRVLTLVGSLGTGGQPLTLLSSAAGTALVVNSGGVVNGAATVQRYIDPSLNAGLGYRHYSAPVANTTVADLATSGFAPVVNPTYNASATPTLETPFPTVFGYDQSRLALTNNLSAFDKGYFSPGALTDPLAVGRGYTVNIGASQLVDFVGTLNNGTVALGLSRNAGPTAADAGWQLLGNPYPAPLDYSLVAPADRTNLDAAVYVFESTSQYNGQYRSYVNGVGGNPVIPSGQGFFARVSAGQTSGTLTFRNSQRLTSFDATPVRRGTSETRPLVQLTLRGATGTASDETYVYFQAGATAGVDAQYDAVKLPNTTGLNLASLAAGTPLAINGLPYPNAATLTVPLAVAVPVTGTYSLTAAQVLNFPAGAQPYLRDLQLGTLTDLRLTPAYTFTQNAANTAARFELVFGPQQVLGAAAASLAAQVALFPNPASKAVYLELPASLRRTATTAALLDAVGRVVLTQALPAGLATHTLPLTGLASGVYSLRLQTEAGVVVKKLVVE
ncbi:Ig-like domain-containing protein [Hymenobacter sp. 5317J-9]|uniref:Ig-like domain-containing protein n=1 Tax=Hymenobacter sp. 5317J-9 TaxID=2932250 RepID=UPI001FD6F8CA|nr:Ig-like domain-containing protein [Hymenobacter sp. 5317J-9]UOQ96461.1 Ig-like domain-containing protein [Hymenobacter sp. 5317J-9]